MNPTQPFEAPVSGLRVRDIVLWSGVTLLFVVLVGVTGYFRLSPEAAILRDSAMAGASGTWHKKIAVHVGFCTTGLVRAGSHLFHLQREPQAAFDSIRGGEVGIYKLQDSAGPVNHRAILARADKAMSARRWDRVIGVSQDQQLVAVYAPHRGLSSDRIRCCVLVLNGCDLIVAGGSGSLDPLMEIAKDHLDLKDPTRTFALR